MGDILLDHAIREIKTADYLLTMTYKSVGDSKILATVLDKMYDAVENALKAFGIKSAAKNPTIEMLLRGVMTRHSLDRQQVAAIKEIAELRELHKEAATEFRYKEKLVLGDDKFRLVKLDEQKIKRLLAHAKAFISFAHETLNNQ
ncbi:MAG: hypothetical protein H6502_01630 [Candidatus Woesearchaeota archaeon]|nr:MAG: hypothetical protein H6502_01630 [Candidatus Woesearchaeota archaeon]